MAFVSLKQLLDHPADVRPAVTGAMRRALIEDPAEFDPRKFLKDFVAAARGLYKARFEAFGSDGNAARIKPRPLGRFAKRFAEAA